MEHTERPIGIFDSGVGGLSVLAEVQARLPHESLLYVADQRFAPYGDRSMVEVADRSMQIAGQLIEGGAKLVTVACNSASAASLQDLRAAFPDVPFVGMEPAVKPAALHSESGVIGVLATATTFQGELFASLVDRHADGVTVLPSVGRHLASLVESGTAEWPEVKDLLRDHLDPLLDAGMDTLVLGCTHYTFLTPVIRAIVGDDVQIVDPAPAVARQVEHVLDERSLRASGDEPGTLSFATTGDPEVFEAQMRRVLPDLLDVAVHRW